MFVRSVRAQCGGARNLRQVRSGDGGIPTVAVETSSVWANLVTAAVLLLSPLVSPSTARHSNGGRTTSALRPAKSDHVTFDPTSSRLEDTVGHACLDAIRFGTCQFISTSIRWCPSE